MTHDRDRRPDPQPDHEMEGRVNSWLTDTDLSPDEAQRGLGRLLDEFPVTPQTRRRFLGRWFDRDEGARRRATDHDHPPKVNRRKQFMYSATGLVAAIAVLALSASVIDTDSAPPAAGDDAVHTVNADGSADFSTITEAVAAAADGDTVMVGPGTYTEAVIIDKDLTLSGDGPREEIVINVPADGPEVTVVLDGGDGDDEEWGGRYGVWLTAPEAVLSDLTVATPYEATGLVVSAGSPIIERVSFIGIKPEKKSFYEGYTAMLITGETTATIRESDWDGYAAVRSGASALFDGNTVSGETISIDGPGETFVRNNSFIDGGSVSTSWKATGAVEDNQFVGGGIGVDTGSSMEIRGNTVDDSGDDPGIYVSDPGTHADVVGNTVTDAKTGVWVGGGGSATIEGNSLSTTQVGITLAGGGSVIDQNIIDSEGAGIVVISGAKPTITGNDITATRRGIAVGRRSDPTIRDNVVCGGTESIHVDEGAEATLENNQLCEAA